MWNKVPSETDLKAWRDAATGGGLPRPRRSDRWQPLRAGVVNLWEFSIIEYWYANGWAQLTGRNETGKSSLMALTTLIPWMGSIIPANIDTLGDQGKTFRYYVEPTSDPGDRRNGSVDRSQGWLWVEYGRLSAEGAEEYFTVGLFAQTQRGRSEINTAWCTLSGPARIRRDIALVHQRTIVAPKNLEDHPGFVAHASAADYQNHVAARLLGANRHRLNSIGKLLRMVRTPKLGERLNAAFVTDKLREAMPELSRSEIQALAKGWDQLDQLRTDLESARAASSKVKDFVLSAWQPCVRSRVRRHTDEATSARTAFDNVTRRERQARQRHADALEEGAELGQAQAVNDATLRSARAGLRDLEDSQRFRDASTRLDQLSRAERERDDRNRAATLAAAERTESQQRLQYAVRDLAGATDRRDRCEAAADLARSNLAERARAAGLTIEAAAPDLARLEQGIRERHEHTGHALELHQAAEEKEATAHTAEQLYDTLNAAAQEARQDADNRWSAAERTRDLICQDMAAWSDLAMPAVSATVLESWLDGLPTIAGAPGPSLYDRARSDWFASPDAELTRREYRADSAIECAREAIDEVRQQIRLLREVPTPQYPAPIGWARRVRPGHSLDKPGAPLWTLLDPNDGAAEELAPIEAALAAMGLLDAWVSPDGAYLAQRDGSDAVVTTAPHPVSRGNLAAQLQAATDAGPLEPVVRQLLETIALVPATAALPTDCVAAVSHDGRWRMHTLSGRAHPLHDHAEWIGEAARAAQRRRQLHELSQRLAELGAERDQAIRERDRLRIEHDALRAHLEKLPRDQDLRSELTRAEAVEQNAVRAQLSAQTQHGAATRARAAANQSRSRFLEYANQRALPSTAAELAGVRQRVHDTHLAMNTYRHEREKVADALQQHDAAAQRHHTAIADAEHRTTLATQTATMAVQAAETATRYRRLVDADDASIHAEHKALQADVEAAETERARLNERALNLATAVARAEAELSQATSQREKATEQRDRAYARFRSMIEAGDLDELGVQIPDPNASTIEKTRIQVSVVNEAVLIKDWPADPSEQMDQINGLQMTLVNKAEEVRAALEPTRTMRVLTEPVLAVEIITDSTGVPLGPRPAVAQLETIVSELEAAYGERVRRTLDELLGSTFIDHLRGRLKAMAEQVDAINLALQQRPVHTTSTMLRVSARPRDEKASKVIDAISGDILLNEAAASGVRDYLRGLVEQAKEDAQREKEADWQDRLAETLDYRRWFDFTLQTRSGRTGQWVPLTRRRYAELSGGARVVILLQPLIATLAATYSDLPSAPHPLWLDEAFDGLDQTNRENVLGLLMDFDLDVLMAGPSRVVNSKAVPLAAIYQVVRAPEPEPGADLVVELWSGDTLTTVDMVTESPQVPVTATLFDEVT